jgi:YVTN family beta-propeller protein
MYMSWPAVKRQFGRFASLSCLAACAMGAHAQSTLLQQSFSSGLGGFSSAGNVTTSSLGATMTAALLSTDGAITSPAISTVGHSNITVAFDRLTAGLDLGEGGVAEYSVNGGSFSQIESTRVTTSGRVSFTLPTSAANQASVVLRFRVNANSSTESYRVNNITVAGTSTGGGGNASRPPIGDFVTFESGHVRPMALNSSGTRLYAVNTPDNRVEVFDVSGGTPTLVDSIPVGMEPVAVALANDNQLWVVNHLSDSVSIVDVSTLPGKVINTLLVGDEPRDIVFAGAGNKWAFITAAHRGQNTGFDPRLTTAGVGRADVWVFAVASPGTRLGGQAVTRLNMFGDTLRGLARNADGTRVYAAVFNSGNKTTILTDDMQEGGIDKPPPFTAADGTTQPQTGLIVQKNANGDWVDNGDPRTGVAPRSWNSRVRMNLPDYDVFTIDTTGTLPTVTGRVSGVGTTLFNLAVNPASGKVYVSNQEARNVVRFEGPGTRSTTVRGHFVESRITVVDGSTVSPRHLNKHITSYNAAVGTAAEKAASLATPLEMAISPDGGTLYLAAMGSNKLGRFSTAQLEANTFTPSASSHVTLTGGGPTGVVLDAPRNRAFVTTRFDNGLSVVNTSSFTEAAHVRMANPEPAVVVNGRPFLYDAQLTSSRGDSSCSGCHIFGDMDQLAWDLGNPDERRVQNPTPYNVNIPRFGRNTNLHPMKGPMTTQSLRGMTGNGPMHWRGDRTGASRVTGQTVEDQAFKDFNPAFTGLLGRESQLTAAQMDAFTKFALKLTYPPSPILNLDLSLTSAQAAGQTAYNTITSDTLTTCNGCHVVNPAANRFGTDGTMAIEGGGVDEDMKIPHLRNMYQKVGMFGENTQVSSAPQVGDQIRGFGFDNSGASGTVFKFLSAAVFTLNTTQRANVEQFVLAMNSEMNPIVGQQVTVTPANASQSDITARLNLLVSRARVTSPRPECELIAKGVISGQQRGWVMNASQQFVPNKSGEAAQSLSGLLSQASTAGAPLTFTCVPPGNGTRFGVDRDANGTLDRD